MQQGLKTFLGCGRPNSAEKPKITRRRQKDKGRKAVKKEKIIVGVHEKKAKDYIC